MLFMDHKDTVSLAMNVCLDIGADGSVRLLGKIVVKTSHVILWKRLGINCTRGKKVHVFNL